MTMALGGGEWSAAGPGRTLPPGKTWYPLYRRQGGPQGRSGRVENLAPLGFDPRTVQPLVSHYTNWATWPMTLYWVVIKSTSGWQVSKWITRAQHLWSSTLLRMWYFVVGRTVLVFWRFIEPLVLDCLDCKGRCSEPSKYRTLHTWWQCHIP